jgi:hypothetical protein
MNEFDLRLESELRRLLNPIAAAPAPVRRPRANLSTDDGLSPGQPRPGGTLVPVAVETFA